MVLFIALFVGLALPFGAQPRSIKRSVMMHVVEEEVNGILFTQRTDTVDGSCRQVWAIAGKAVPEEEYFQVMAREEAQELQHARRQEQQRVYEHQHFVAREQCAITKKLLCKEVCAVQQQLNKALDARLEPYRAFEGASFSSPEVFDEFVKKFKNIQEALNRDVSLPELQESLAWLQPYKDRTAIFYMNTVQAARERSDDTRLLKDLLELVIH